MRRWTDEEDDLLIDNRAHAGSWVGWRTMLPHRSEASINIRRQKLGIQFDHGGNQSGITQAPRPTQAARSLGKAFRRPGSTSPWTDEQRMALVRSLMGMLEDTGHSFRECMDELGRLVSEREPI